MKQELLNTMFADQYPLYFHLDGIAYDDYVMIIAENSALFVDNKYKKVYLDEVNLTQLCDRKGCTIIISDANSFQKAYHHVSDYLKAIADGIK